MPKVTITNFMGYVFTAEVVDRIEPKPGDYYTHISSSQLEEEGTTVYDGTVFIINGVRITPYAASLLVRLAKEADDANK
jgi:hypothetical protein